VSRPTALVIGGTGPTGPLVVEGLAERGYAVTILHAGQHEVEFAVPGIAHIHADPHFAETLTAGLDGATYDLVVAQYGRLRVIADVLRGRTARLIGIGAAVSMYAGARDERWGAFGRPAIVPDTSDVFVRDAADGKLQLRVAQAVESLFAHHAEGAYSATYLGYPNAYGPRQLAPLEWCVIRRALDGRREFVVPDGGLRMDSRIYTGNAAHAALLVVDHPDVAAGKRYTAGDRSVFTVRRRIEFIAERLGHRFDLVDLPWDLAWPSHPFCRNMRDHMLNESTLLRSELGYEDPYGPADAMGRTVDWLLANRPEPGGEEERRLGDPFDYAGEDALITRWRHARGTLDDVESPLVDPGHFYRHPKKPEESWRPR
jgi:nucleoside-diphosphate-sugar epimerase